MRPVAKTVVVTMNITKGAELSEQKNSNSKHWFRSCRFLNVNIYNYFIDPRSTPTTKNYIRTRLHTSKLEVKI